MLKIIKKFLFVLIAVAAITNVLPAKADTPADTPADQALVTTQSVGVCDSGQDHSTFLTRTDLETGTIYAQLSNSTESGDAVSIFTQSFSDYKCQGVGTVNLNTTSWVKVGNYTIQPNVTTSIVASGNGLQAQPYASVVKVLLAPTSQNICDPTNCTVTYKGSTGTLSPRIISGATDEVAVYKIDPIDNLNPTRVDYYDNGTFIYKSNTIAAVNRNYLPGGPRQITINAFFANNEELTVNKVVNMGPDYGYTLLIRSIFYRSHDKTLLWLFVISTILLILALISLIHRAYKHRQEVKSHGLEDYHAAHPEDNDDSDNDAVVGG